MASYGAKNPYFSRIKSEPDLGLPVYDGEPIKIGRLVKSDITLTMASGTLYADDELAESAEEFIGGDIVMETDDILDSVASKIYGAKVKEKRVIYNTGDNPPPGGLAYYKKLMRRGNIVYKCLFFPRVKAALGDDTAQTKSDSITFGTSTTKFKLYSCNNGDWRHTEEFDNEADALAWVKAQLSPPAAEGGEETVSAASGFPVAAGPLDVG